MTSKKLISTDTDEFLMEVSILLEEAYMAEDLSLKDLQRIVSHCETVIKRIDEDVIIYS